MITYLALPATGPHGAGLANMVFAPRNATIAEFTMSPHCNRCFGYMAAALGLDYWVIPEVRRAEMRGLEGVSGRLCDGEQCVTKC